jgi:hypothetical protein
VNEVLPAKRVDANSDLVWRLTAPSVADALLGEGGAAHAREESE